jgi:hypothetical protein
MRRDFRLEVLDGIGRKPFSDFCDYLRSGKKKSIGGIYGLWPELA